MRAARLALRALNVELAQVISTAHTHSLKGCVCVCVCVCMYHLISQVKDAVSEKKIGEMRMQFWRDAIDLAFKV